MTELSVVVQSFLVGLGIAGLGCFVITLWAIVDAVSTPPVDFISAGTGKVRWIAMLAVFYFFTLIGGLFLAIIYLTVTRRKLREGRIRSGGHTIP